MKKSIGLLTIISIICLHACLNASLHGLRAQQVPMPQEADNMQDVDNLQPNVLAFGGFSMNQYLGDLQSANPAYTGALSLGILLNRGKRFTGSFELSYGQISGQDTDYRFQYDENATPNRFFSSTIFGAHYNLHLNILKKEHFTLYLSQGLGLLRYSPVDDLGRSLQDRFETRAPNESYGNSSMMFPTKLGMIYLLPNQWGLGLQAGYLNPMTDYLDNISEWGNKPGNDNIIRFRFAVFVPLD